jgi:predicted HTH transcriptional regulator
MDYMRTHPKATQVEIATSVGKSRRSVQSAIASLKEKGFVMREGARNSGRWIVTQQP